MTTALFCWMKAPYVSVTAVPKYLRWSCYVRSPERSEWSYFPFVFDHMRRFVLHSSTKSHIYESFQVKISIWEIKLDGLINKNREDLRINIAVQKSSSTDFDVDLPDLICPDVFLISVLDIIQTAVNLRPDNYSQLVSLCLIYKCKSMLQVWTDWARQPDM